MRTWAEVVARLEEHFTIAIRGEDWVGIRHGSDPEAPAAQKVKVSLTSALGRPWLAIVAEVIDAHVLDPEAAVAINHELVVGALMVEDGRLLLQQLVPLTGLDIVDLRRVVLYVARLAEFLRRWGEPGTSREAFAHYAE